MVTAPTFAISDGTVEEAIFYAAIAAFKKGCVAHIVPTYKSNLVHHILIRESVGQRIDPEIFCTALRQMLLQTLGKRSHFEVKWATEFAGMDIHNAEIIFCDASLSTETTAEMMAEAIGASIRG